MISRAMSAVLRWAAASLCGDVGVTGAEVERGRLLISFSTSSRTLFLSATATTMSPDEDVRVLPRKAFQEGLKADVA